MMDANPNEDDPPVQTPARREVLVLENVSFRDPTRQSLTLRDANLRLHEGEFATLGIPIAAECRSFTSMLQGLRMPQQGRISFDGKNWEGDDFSQHDWMRSRIGRVYDGTAWIENLNIYENVTLSERHHTPRTIDDIDRELREWCDFFEIDDMRGQRPAFVGKAFLKICEWIRALLGSPLLLLLEHPMRSVPRTRFDQLIKALRMMTSRGTAVLWIGRENDLDDLTFPEQTLHYRAVNNKLVLIDEGGQ
ncbi:MAG: hypothetical protein R3C05_31020 [Pirellulaceae bacterium]